MAEIKKKRKKYVPKKGFRDNVEKMEKLLHEAKKSASPMEWSKIHELERRLASAAHKCTPHNRKKKGRSNRESTTS